MALGPRLRTKQIDGYYKGEEIQGNVQNWRRGRSTVVYLDEQQRESYRLYIEDGRLVDSAGEVFDTGSAKTWDNRSRAIFVIDEDGRIFASCHQKVGEFHHSSLVAGEAVAMAGEIEVRDGRLFYISRRSGHYRPDRELMEEAVAFLRSVGLDMDSARIDYDLMQ